MRAAVGSLSFVRYLPRMLSQHTHVALALGMLVLGTINAWLMLEAFGGRTPIRQDRVFARSLYGGRHFGVFGLSPARSPGW